jgi:TPP-dependent pyruvate/acetoin dehydrogenase alpha subunit
MTPDDLREFTAEIAAEFNAAKIPHPVHLSDGNEEQLIHAFRDIAPNDWVCGTWRMHYQSLLKGVSRETLKAAIRSGQSIGLCFPEQRIVSSAIVGGILPIAVGIAMGIKRTRADEWVHCFLGDMAATGGMFHECRNYAAFHGLQLRWIIEDNGHSVCTPTQAVWGKPMPANLVRYEYRSKYPHAGAGQRVMF